MSRTLRPLAAAAIGIALTAGAAPAGAAPAATAATAAESAAPRSAGATPVVRTDRGAVRGAQVDGVDRYLGIPYAAAPVGDRRWRAPQAAVPWDGVRSATRYGARCAALPSTNGARSDAEDCLFVNVERPSGHGAGSLPVYVFVHGGGLVNGSSDQAGGEKIVRETGAITVTMNYRLGVFGFLGLPELDRARGNGNFGFLDQQAALRWVQRNIAAFGGDPARVTLGGESAGAFSVCGHLTSRASRGLFSQAVLQSGSCTSRPLAATHAEGREFAGAAGCGAARAVLRCLRRTPAADVLDASSGFSPSLTSGTAVLPVPTQAALEAGQLARVPVVVGANRDEGRTFSQGFIGADREAYTAFVRGAYGEDADAVLARYPWPADADRFTAAYLVGAVMTDSGLIAGLGGCANLRFTQTLAQHVPTYAYEFAARRGPGLVPIPGYVWGAGHAAELAYLFPSFDNGTPIAPTFDAGERQLARDMVRYWGSFVFDGDPSAQGLAAWPRYDADRRILSLRVGGNSRTISTAAYRAAHRCGFWDALQG